MCTPMHYIVIYAFLIPLLWILSSIWDVCPDKLCCARKFVGFYYDQPVVGK